MMKPDAATKKKPFAASRKRQRKKIYTSEPLMPNRGEEIQYALKLSALCRPMLKRVYREITQLYRETMEQISLKKTAMDAGIDDIFIALDSLRDYYQAEFDFMAEPTAAAMVENVTKNSMRDVSRQIANMMKTKLESAEIATHGVSVAESAVISPTPAASSIKLGFGIPGNIFTTSENIRIAVEASIQENVSLIKSIPAQFLDRVAGAVTRSMQSGGSTKQLAQEIKQYAKMTDRRAKNIALDQTRKAYNAANVRGFQDAGIKKFKWIHVGGSVHPRHLHLQDYPQGLNGGIFSIDDPPVIEEKTGIKGFPAQLPYCRCIMAAVFED